MKIGTQCIACDHASAPAADPYVCEKCGGLDLHVFPVVEIDGGDMVEIDADLVRKLTAPVRKA